MRWGGDDPVTKSDLYALALAIICGIIIGELGHRIYGVFF
jgi:hypothetical protein